MLRNDVNVSNLKKKQLTFEFLKMNDGAQMVRFCLKMECESFILKCYCLYNMPGILSSEISLWWKTSDVSLKIGRVVQVFQLSDSKNITLYVLPPPKILNFEWMALPKLVSAMDPDAPKFFFS